MDSVRLYMTFKSISDGYLMPTLIAGIANSVMLRLYMIFKSFSTGELMPTLIARIANTLMLRLYMFLTLHRVVKKILTPAFIRY